MSVASLGASNNAYSYLQSLLPQQSSASGAAQASDPVQKLLAAFYPSGADGQSPSTGGSVSASGATSSCPGGGCALFSPDTMASLISIQGQDWSNRGGSVEARAEKLFGGFDADSDGQISQSEFENVFGSNADMSKVDGLFDALDADGDGGISQDELTSAAQQSHARHRHHAPSGEGGLADLLSSIDLSGATSQTSSGADGSTSTTITYADGSTVTMTTPASSGSDSSTTGHAGGRGNLLERLIQLQSQFLTALASQTNASA
jgi:EF hand